jgi:hypothetical protein
LRAFTLLFNRNRKPSSGIYERIQCCAGKRRRKQAKKPEQEHREDVFSGSSLSLFNAVFLELSLQGQSDVDSFADPPPSSSAAAGSNLKIN